MRVTVRAKLFVGFQELIPLELETDNLVHQYTATFPKYNEERVEEVS